MTEDAFAQHYQAITGAKGQAINNIRNYYRHLQKKYNFFTVTWLSRSPPSLRLGRRTRYALPLRVALWHSATAAARTYRPAGRGPASPAAWFDLPMQDTRLGHVWTCPGL